MRTDARSLDEKKAQAVVDEIKAAGGDALAVGGDVAADDFPEKVLSATIKCVRPNSPFPLPYLRCVRVSVRGGSTSAQAYGERTRLAGSTGS